MLWCILNNYIVSVKFGYFIICVNRREFKRFFWVSVCEFELLGFYGMIIIVSVNNMYVMEVFMLKVYIFNFKIIVMGFVFYGE